MNKYSPQAFSSRRKAHPMTKLGKRVRSSDRKTGQPAYFWTLGRKFIVAHLGHILVLGVLLGWGAYWVVQRPSRGDKPPSLKALAQSVAEVCEKEIGDLGLQVKNRADVSPDYLSNAIRSAVKPGKSIIAVIDNQGRILFSTEKSRPPVCVKNLNRCWRRTLLLLCNTGFSEKTVLSLLSG